jgi:hypothetical protein
VIAMMISLKLNVLLAVIPFALMRILILTRLNALLAVLNSLAYATAATKMMMKTAIAVVATTNNQ